MPGVLAESALPNANLPEAPFFARRLILSIKLRPESPVNQGCRWEGSLVQAGATILRGQDEIHGLVLARTTRIDAIVVDVGEALSPGQAGIQRFLQNLRRHPKTKRLPVLVLVPPLRQCDASISGFRLATSILARHADATAVLEELRYRISEQDRMPQRRIDAAVESVDAVFSEIGDGEFTIHSPHRPAERSPFERSAISHSELLAR